MTTSSPLGLITSVPSGSPLLISFSSVGVVTFSTLLSLPWFCLDIDPGVAPVFLGFDFRFIASVPRGSPLGIWGDFSFVGGLFGFPRSEIGSWDVIVDTPGVAPAFLGLDFRVVTSVLRGGFSFVGGGFCFPRSTIGSWDKVLDTPGVAPACLGFDLSVCFLVFEIVFFDFDGVLFPFSLAGMSDKDPSLAVFVDIVFICEELKSRRAGERLRARLITLGCTINRRRQRKEEVLLARGLIYY